jgi:homoserine O-succinyltransferase
MMYFLAPHSRHTDTPSELLKACPELTILAESEEAGVYLAMAENGQKIFVTGHSEYDRMTLKNEYDRDKGIRDDVNVPVNYFPNDDPNERPLLTWRSHSINLYSNWLNYYVYQMTPYDVGAIGK